MRVLISFATGLCLSSALASAAATVTYTATDSPGNSPDASNGTNTVNAWTETITPGTSGGAGSYYYSGTGWNANSWVIYSYPNATGALIDETHAFDSALAVGQTLSISFAISATDAGQSVGISLTGGSSPLSFTYTGGDPDGRYRYNDSSTTGGDTKETFVYQVPFIVSFTLTSATTYSASAGTGSWNGTYSGPITGIDVFNHAAGNGSDVAFNALSITNATPEPALAAVFGLGCVSLFARRRQRVGSARCRFL